MHQMYDQSQSSAPIVWTNHNKMLQLYEPITKKRKKIHWLKGTSEHIIIDPFRSLELINHKHANRIAKSKEKHDARESLTISSMHDEPNSTVFNFDLDSFYWLVGVMHAFWLGEIPESTCLWRIIESEVYSQCWECNCSLCERDGD